jgi:feruloyl-CoA synthase
MTVEPTVQTFARPRISVRRRDDGSMLLTSLDPLADHESDLAASLYRWADLRPAEILAAERRGEEWSRLTYGEALRRAEAVGEALLVRGLGPDRPLVVLSGNSLDHLVLTLAGYVAGIPVVSLSAAYAIEGGGHRRLRDVVRTVRAGAVFAQNGDESCGVLSAVRDLVPCLITAAGGTAAGCEPLHPLTLTSPGTRLARARAAVTGASVAKILLTSGSTGEPKAVPNTHGMLCAVQQMMRQAWPFLAESHVTLVDWLPWSHTFGGNHNLHMVLTTGGTMYIDDGGPTPERFPLSVRNLAGMSPNMYFNVPAGFAMLADELERDSSFATGFFAEMHLLLSAGAPLPDVLRHRILAVARRVAGHKVRFTSSWGLTETSSAATTAHLDTDDRQAIGVPLPGIRLKLAPVDGRLEMRVAGPTVMPGYLRRPDLDALAFDDEGFYRTGDAATLIDEEDPARGLAFDGRIAEDFKLVTGTWVRVGALRAALLEAVDGLADVVITGPGRPYAGALVWLRPGTGREAVVQALTRYNDGARSSRRIARMLVLTEPAARDAGELSDKGSVNQRRVLERRAGLVDRLYAEPAPPDVVALGG